MRENARKMRTRITPNTDTFYAVNSQTIFFLIKTTYLIDTFCTLNMILLHPLDHQESCFSWIGTTVHYGLEALWMLSNHFCRSFTGLWLRSYFSKKVRGSNLTGFLKKTYPTSAASSFHFRKIAEVKNLLK